MSLKRIIHVLVQYQIIAMTSPSITGVTYREHFDFEERYRNANECNPLYWHPLHLPPYCAEVFEKLIRARLATNTPVRITTEREKENTYPIQFTYNYPYPMYQMEYEEYEEYRPPLSPYEQVMELLKEDIARDPSSPTVTVIPNLGPVALYKQAISRNSENRIKSMAEAYVKATMKMYDDYYKTYGKYPPSETQLYVYDSAKNKTIKEVKEPKKKNNKVQRVKTKHGDVVTIIETKNLDVFKKDNPAFH